MNLNIKYGVDIFSKNLVDNAIDTTTITYTQSCDIGLIENNQNDSSVSELSEDSVLLPVSILKNNSSLQAIVLYLKDNKGLKFTNIASLLNRNQRTIWTSYKKSDYEKRSFIDTGSEYFIPVNIFSNRHLSVLENIILYLKSNYDLSTNEISSLLGKKYRTIWTVNRRIMKKLDNNIENDN